ncbi:protein translocase subunit SecF [Herpetosiphon geysericola]|uniref:Protein-export membrane protein SecF n=1 Tax=Herpetosiphon geysericola TaxID=70996 RepID=A0A0P6YET1_9CHLR|nr:protein translocase subunit SecF [Herpetosiphon geysericola]KPL88823.1 preprotein translocase subunit SecF [Herpetosiphon geysericola]
MLDLVRRRYLWFAISILTIIPGLISILVFGMNLGVDFSGGARWEIHIPSISQTRDGLENEINDVFTNSGIEGARTQLSQGTTNNQQFVIAFVRSKLVQSDSAERKAVETGLISKFGADTRIETLQTVGETVRGRSIRNAIVAIFIASLAIMGYLWAAFRGTPNPLRYGVCAIIAMLHDVLVVIGMASILGWLIGLEVDALFMTAVLTVISFSVHDTIVVFDRVRENLRRSSDDYERVVNRSIVQTLTRSINTQFTSFFTLTALLLFGGESIRSFVLILLLGLISGTYSSIFNAAQLLVVWENREWRNWFGRGKDKAKPAAA